METSILLKYIEPHHTISIIGTVKNAGKTTVLNQLISEMENDIIAITSIGLDGEKIDNVTNKPKPRIKVHKNMIIATAVDCLKECTFNYVLHESTKIDTALGKIVIIEATNSGLVLVAGPSKKSEMITLIKTLKKYHPKNIFIDGALFRKSIAATSVSDSIILSTGAAYNSSMEAVIKDTKTLVDQLLFLEVDKHIKTMIIDQNENFVINDDTSVENIGSFWSDDNGKAIDHVSKNSKYLYLKGALTNSLAAQIFDRRHIIGDLTIIVKDATHIVCDYKNYEILRKMNIRINVLNKIKLLFVSTNSWSPYGYEFDAFDFKTKLQKNIDVDCIDVIKDME